MLEDIAILTGGTVISEEKGIKLENERWKCLVLRKITVNKDDTIIVNGAGKKKTLLLVLPKLKSTANTTSDYDAKTSRAFAKLSGGVAVLYVGAASEVEMKKKDRR